MGPEYVAAFEAAAPYIFGAGTAASLYGQNQQAKEKRHILNRAMDQSDQDQEKAIVETVDQAKSMSGQDRMRQMQEAEAANYDRTQTDLKGAGADLIDTAQPEAGYESGQFAQAKATKAAEEGDRLNAVARELAKVRSSGDVQTDQGMKLARLAEGLGSMWNTNKLRGRAAGQDAEDVGIGGIGQLGQIAQIIGGAGMMAGGGAAGATGANVAATNPALIESAVGTAGYGGSTATTATPSLFASVPKKRPVYSWAGR